MSELYDTIKSSILGTKSTNIDRQIDSSFQSIERLSINSDRNRYLEAIKSLVSKTGVDTPDNIIKSIQNGTQIQNYDQTGRVSRYGEYEAITKKIPYCQRALDTLTDYIIAPDDITKQSLQMLIDGDYEDTSILKTTMARCHQIEKKIKLDNKIRKILRTTLHKGDNFVEIIHSPKGEHAFTILQEKAELLGSCINRKVTIKESVIKENGETTIEDVEYNFKVQLEATAGTSTGMGTPAGWAFGGVLAGMGSYAAGTNIRAGRAITSEPYIPNSHSKDAHIAKSDPEFEDQEHFKSKFSEPHKEKENNKIDLKNIFITIHNPRYIVRLETERFKTCLGFLVFPKLDPSMAATANTLMGGTLNSVDALCADIIKQIETKLRNDNDKIHMSDDIKKSILNYLSVVKKNEDLKVRYVPPEKMIHWRIKTDTYDPYGESIFDCVNYDCRLLIALKTATTIKRLTYATDKRVISVETGLPRDAKNIIETIKEGLSKKKISVDTMGSLDNIPSQIPTFETIYIPMRDGKKFVEFDKMEWGMNPQEDIEPLKFMRDGIVANLGVPAPYLGLEENTSNRNLLTAENINFCRTIIAYQKDLSIPLKEMFEKIYKIVFPDDYENLEKIIITFQSPRISPYEHQMEYVEQMQRLIEALKTLGVPVNWMKKKYLPHLEWDEIEKYAAQESIAQELGEEPAAQEIGGGIALPPSGGMY